MQSRLILSAIAVCAGIAQAQSSLTYNIKAYAGSPRLLGDSGPATQALLWSPRGVSADRSGNIYISDTGDDLVRRVSQDGTITTIAGNGGDLFGGDNGPAVQAILSVPYRTTLAPTGELYIADAANNRIRRVARDGTITTVAGNGQRGFSGDGGPATLAMLDSPREVALDSRGNLYILDTNNNRIRRVTPAGIIQTYAGNGFAGFFGDGGQATLARLNYPLGIAIDSSDTLYIADTSNHRIRAVTNDGTISTISGSGIQAFGGDNGPASSASFNGPSGIAVDASGNLYIADTGNERIRKIVRGGNISTIAGSGQIGFGGDGGLATAALLNTPRGVGVDALGNVYIADTENHRVRRVTPQGTITTVAGSDPASGDRGPAVNARLFQPSGLAVDNSGNVYISDSSNQKIRKVTPQGIISTFAGTGVAGYSGDNGTASGAQFQNPNGLAFDRSGNLYVADTDNHVIRRITPGGLINTVAGTGIGGNSGDTGPATQATLRNPNAVAFDTAGNMYIADSGNNRVRKVGADGIIRHFAGDSGANFGFAGDGGLAQTALLNYPRALAVDDRGFVYIADFFNNRVRRVNGTDGSITTVAGTGSQGASGDNGNGSQASLYLPSGLALDANRNLYIADSLNERIRLLSANGILSTIAGTGGAGDSGDDGLALNASLNTPRDVAVDASGIIYFSDQDNHRIRLLAVQTTSIKAVVNAASQVAGAVSPGEIVTITGTRLGPVAGVPGPIVNGVLGTSAGGVRVLFDGVAAPLLYVSANQINAIVPYSTTGRGGSQVQVELQGTLSSAAGLAVAAAAPGIFTLNGLGTGQAAALNQDGTLNSPSNPADRGSIVVLFATGEGQTNPAGVSGLVATGLPPAPVLGVSALIGGQPADILYAGGAPSAAAGLLQVNARVPATAAPGNAVPVGISVGSFGSQPGVTISVK